MALGNLSILNLKPYWMHLHLINSNISSFSCHFKWMNPNPVPNQVQIQSRFTMEVQKATGSLHSLWYMYMSISSFYLAYHTFSYEFILLLHVFSPEEKPLSKNALKKMEKEKEKARKKAEKQAQLVRNLQYVCIKVCIWD